MKKSRNLIFSLFFLFGMVNSLRAVETVIKGGQMDLLDKGEKVLFKKGVKMTRGTDILIADEMETNKTRDQIKARGHVSLFRKVSESESVVAQGKEGQYNSKTGEGQLRGGFKRAHFTYTEVLSSTRTRVVDVWAEKISFSKNNNEATAEENVYGKSIDDETGNVYEFWSDRADYFADKKILELKGEMKPRVRQILNKNEKRITGKLIVYHIDSKNFVAEGEAEAVFIDEPKEKK